MSKQLILITAPFNCGYCETAKKELPSLVQDSMPPVPTIPPVTGPVTPFR